MAHSQKSFDNQTGASAPHFTGHGPERTQIMESTSSVSSQYTAIIADHYADGGQDSTSHFLVMNSDRELRLIHNTIPMANDEEIVDWHPLTFIDSNMFNDGATHSEINDVVSDIADETATALIYTFEEKSAEALQ